MKKNGVLVDCGFCGKSLYKSPCFLKEKNYCSKQCYHNSMSKKITLKCLSCGEDYKVAISFFNLRGSKYCSVKCRGIGMAKNYSGSNSHRWVDGSSYNKRIRKGIEWKQWREAVFKRDDYKCQDCGIRSGKGIKVEIHPHHIKQYAIYPKLRFNVDNGLTLCKECHKKTDTYLKPLIKLERHLATTLKMKGFLLGDLLALSCKIDTDQKFTNSLIKILRNDQRSNGV